MINIDNVVQTGFSRSQGVCTKIRCLGNDVKFGAGRRILTKKPLGKIPSCFDDSVGIAGPEVNWRAASQRKEM